MTVDNAPQAPGAAASGRRRGTVQPYDFRRPTTLAREHARALEVAFETFGRQWTTQLLSRLRTACTVTLTSVAAATYDEYVRSLPAHTVMLTFTPDDSRAAAVLQLSPVTTLDSLDWMLGGRGSDSHPERELTEIETRLVSDLAGRVFGDLAYAFAAIAPLAPKLTGVAYNPQFLQAAEASSVMLVATFAVSVGDGAAEHSATIALPSERLLKRLAAMSGGAGRTEEQVAAAASAAATLSRSVPEVPLAVSARLAALQLRPGAVLDLAPGDVLRLPHPTTRPLELVASGVVLARAVAGTSGSRLACLVVAPEEENR